jgi:hypothetical protein
MLTTVTGLRGQPNGQRTHALTTVVVSITTQAGRMWPTSAFGHPALMR